MTNVMVGVGDSAVGGKNVSPRESNVLLGKHQHCTRGQSRWLSRPLEPEENLSGIGGEWRFL